MPLIPTTINVYTLTIAIFNERFITQLYFNLSHNNITLLKIGSALKTDWEIESNYRISV